MKKNEKMKARPAFVVPLVDEAVAIVTTMRDRRPAGELVFRPTDLRQTAASRARLCVATCVGGRSVGARFSVIAARFLGDRTNVEREIAEMCLAHFAKGVEAAYRRSTAWRSEG